MGCAQSKIDNEESVARCKERKILMKEAVAARNGFASGHSGYAISLKNIGAALSDYGHGEAEQNQDQQIQIPPMDSTPQPPPPPPISMMDNLPPPPPLPSFSPSPPVIQRAVSMPADMLVKSRKEFDASLAINEEDEEEIEEEEEERRGEVNREGKGPQLEEITPPHTPEKMNVATPPPMPAGNGMAWDYFFMPEPSMDEIEHESPHHFQDNNVGVGYGADDTEIEPKTPEKAEQTVTVEEEEVRRDKGKEPAHIEHSKTVPADFRSRVNYHIEKATGPSVSLSLVLNQIDDHFLKASENAQEVSKLLEATRLHYHSNFADNRGHIDHSARVMRVITWNRSFRNVANGEGGNDFDSEEHETHATVLEKLQAWEKKLYDEVKQGEMMKLEYRRKVALLNKQKKRGASAESLEKTKAAVSHLHTRYIVDMQSMDSTVAEVNRLRDEQLYPKLVSLVDGMANMWSNLCQHHVKQLDIVTNLKSLDTANAPKETTKLHREQTGELYKVVQKWHTNFQDLVTNQKKYIQGLNSWLKLNLIPIESSLKEKISSPPRVQHPPIQALLHSWHDYLERLPDEVAKSAISSFAAVIETILHHQEEEIKLKEKCEETGREYFRKNQAFEEWYQKYMQRRTPSDETEAERGDDANAKDPVSDRRFAVESLKKRWEEEIEAHQKHCLQVREKSLGSLKIRLPELFRALSDYSHACSDAYERLRSITNSQKRNAAPS